MQTCIDERRSGAAVRQKDPSKILCRLPSVSDLLLHPELVCHQAHHSILANAARCAIAALRQEIIAEGMEEPELERAIASLPRQVERRMARTLMPSLRKVINATGVILHTNLGRAPISRTALRRLCDAAEGYSNLEFDLEKGERGKRDVHVDHLFRILLGDDTKTIVVNNNAAALYLALNSIAEGKEVVVSRGELVEIGDSFRIPDILCKSGARLREVGTTNRTRCSDYENAINQNTAMLLKVHRSNFRIIGFTEQPSLPELVTLGHNRGVLVVDDMGSGTLVDLKLYGISNERQVQDSITSGVDLVTYSGDKMLGGPQAGILTGKPDVVQCIRKNPLFRAFRVDKLTYALLESTLLSYISADEASVPILEMMRLSPDAIGWRASKIASHLSSFSVRVSVAPGASLIGGGAAPSASFPTMLLTVSCASHTAGELNTALRQHDPPVVARVENDSLILDLRTVFPEQDQIVTAALEAALRPTTEAPTNLGEHACD